MWIFEEKSFKSAQLAFIKVKDDIPEASRLAINRTIESIYTNTPKEILKVYAVKGQGGSTAMIKKSMRKMKAGKMQSGGQLIISSRRLTLPTHFKVSPAKRLQKSNPSVKVTIFKGKQKVITTNPKPFVTTLKNGTTQIMKREGKSRYPLIVLRTLTIPQMAMNEEVYGNIQSNAQNTYYKRLEHEVNRMARKAGFK